jgi:hypothetical protein
MRPLPSEETTPPVMKMYRAMGALHQNNGDEAGRDDRLNHEKKCEHVRFSVILKLLACP